MMKRSGNKGQRGFNLVEAAIVLGVVGLVIGGIWVAASTVNQTMRINRMTTGLLTIVSNIRQVLSARDAAALPDAGGYRDIDIICASGAIPADLMQNGLPVTPWGTQFFCAVSQDGTQIQVGMDVPGEAECLRMITGVTSKFRDNSDLISLSVGVSNGASTLYTSWPMSPTGTYCHGIDPPEIIFKFSFTH